MGIQAPWALVLGERRQQGPAGRRALPPGMWSTDHSAWALHALFGFGLARDRFGRRVLGLRPAAAAAQSSLPP